MTDSTTAEVTDKELELINAYSRRKLTKDEVYVSVWFCATTILTVTTSVLLWSRFLNLKTFCRQDGYFDHSPTAKTRRQEFCLFG